MEALIGKKLGMTQVFEESGRTIPVSVIQAGPCPVVQIKTAEKDGYGAIQIGFDSASKRGLTRPVAGHYKKANVEPRRILKEVRVDAPDSYTLGQAISVKIFEGASKVHVSGLTKGRGYTGVTKKHGFKGGKETHGCKSHRVPGSVGNNSSPARVFKGKRLAGRMGNELRTIRNLQVVQIDVENNLLFVRGAVPGANNGVVFIRKA
jgi:large subunit ribosomal protein L3